MKKERVSIIEGADGPTSIFLLGGKGKISIRNRIERRICKIRRYFIEKKITCENHSLEEVETYLLQKYDFVKVSPEAVKTSEEYRQMRAAFIEQYAPELLGEYAVRPQMKGRDPEDIKTFMRLCEERTARAMELPESVFDIDMCKYEKIINSNKNNKCTMDITIEKKYSYIGGGASGSKRYVKEYGKIYKDIHRYYGVTETDVKQKSDRYKKLIHVLSS